MNDCIFCNIRDKKIPATLVYEDEHIMVFPDIHPIKKVHLLIVPKKHIADFLALEDDHLMLSLQKTIQQIVRTFALEQSGYRLVINGGGAQIIDHLHVHLTGPWGKAASLT